jgi:hypothetical protein
MGGPLELIDGQDIAEPIARSDEDSCIAGKCERVAGDGDNPAAARGGKLSRLSRGSLARRIEQNEIAVVQFGGGKRLAEQIAYARRHGLKAFCVAGGVKQSRNRRPVDVGVINGFKYAVREPFE